MLSRLAPLLTLGLASLVLRSYRGRGFLFPLVVSTLNCRRPTRVGPPVQHPYLLYSSQRFVASRTARTLAVSALSRTSHVPVNILLSLPTCAVTPTTTIVRSKMSSIR